MSTEVVLPFVIIVIVVGPNPVTLACNSFTVSFCGNGATEVPRYHVMVGTGLPVEKQEILTEFPSSTVTSPVRFVVIGSPAFNEGECVRIPFNSLTIKLEGHSAYTFIAIPTSLPAFTVIINTAILKAIFIKV